jgi:hypothetical protein
VLADSLQIVVVVYFLFSNAYFLHCCLSLHLEVSITGGARLKFKHGKSDSADLNDMELLTRKILHESYSRDI